MRDVENLKNNPVPIEPIEGFDKRFLECAFARTIGKDGPVKIKMIDPIPRIGQNMSGLTEDCASD